MAERTSSLGLTAAAFRLDFSGREPIDRAIALRAQLESTPSTDHATRARLEAFLVGAITGTDPSGAAAASRRATAHADAAQDSESRAWSLLAAISADLSPHSVESRITTCRELLALLRGGTLPQLAPTAYFLLLGSLAEAGRTIDLDLELGVAGPTLVAFPELAHGRHAAWYRCARATLDGQITDAERFADQGFVAARTAQDPDTDSVYAGQLAIIRWMQGRTAQLEPSFLLGRRLYPGEPVWTAALAWIWLHQGRESAARGLVRSLPPTGSYPRDRNWLAAVTILAAVTAQLGELDLIEELQVALAPFEDRLATIGLGVTLWGTVARSLALLALASGDHDGAVAHYESAIDVCARTGAHAWLAESQVELAQLLVERERPGDVARARQLVDEASTTARALMLHGIEDAAAAVHARFESSIKVVEPLRVPDRPARIEVLGNFRVIGTGGEPARWQSRKARELLKILVARRGAAIDRETLMDLLWPDVAPDLLGNRFSVAASTVRRALDPERALPREAFLETGEIVRLNLDLLDIDAERFLHHAEAAISLPDSVAVHDRFDQLRNALDLYTGEAFVDEPEARWAERLRREAHLAFFAVAHALGELAAELDDHVTRARAYRGIIAIDAFDQRAHAHLVDALARLGAHHQASQARESFATHMHELGIETPTAG